MRIRARSLSASIHVAALLLCLIAGPSHALTFSTSGPGMTPCGAQMCVDVGWGWGGDKTEASSEEVSLVLPMPDPAAWTLSGGNLLSYGYASVGGWFDPAEVAAITSPPYDNIIGVSSVEVLTLGANGATLLWNRSGGLPVYCEDPTHICGDSNDMPSFPYTVVPGDAAFSGPLTLRLNIYRDWDLVALSEFYRLGSSGSAHLVYSAVPEPNTGLLVAVGLLGIAYRQRWYGRPSR